LILTDAFDLLPRQRTLSDLKNPHPFKLTFVFMPTRRQHLAVVFDMDGLLLNTEHLYDLVIGELLASHGRTFTRECKLEMMGRPAQVALEIMKERHQLSADWQALAEEIEDRFASILPTHLELMPGVSDLLGMIADLPLPMTVATSSRRSFAETALRQAQIRDRFQFLLCGEEVLNGKPAPDIYLETARRLDLPPEKLIVLEDSHTGSLAATSARAYTVAVPGEHSAHQDFSHVDLVVPQVNDPRVLALLGLTDPRQ
jgi:HAD superfamily hydrolase (TIGR01509 family)